jgi:hypothetical protein
MVPASSPSDPDTGSILAIPTNTDQDDLDRKATTLEHEST